MFLKEKQSVIKKKACCLIECLGALFDTVLVVLLSSHDEWVSGDWPFSTSETTGEAHQGEVTSPLNQSLHSYLCALPLDCIGGGATGCVANCPRECGSHQTWLLFLKCFQSFTWSTFIFPYQKRLQSWPEELVTLQPSLSLPSRKRSPNTDARDSYDKIPSNFLTDLLKHFWMFIFFNQLWLHCFQGFPNPLSSLAVLNLEVGRLFTLF